MMPAWYWTLIGLLAAACRHQPTPVAPPTRMRFGHRALTASLALLALASLGITTIELTRAVAQGRKQKRPSGRFPSRVYADKTVSARHTAAVMASQVAFRSHRPEDIEAAVAIWRDLHNTIPALHDVPTAYAQALLLAGRQEAARSVLEDALSEQWNPYNVAANSFYASELTDDPVTRLRCIGRALRAGSLNPDLQNILADVLIHPAAVEYLDHGLPRARALATGSTDTNDKTATVELLRISAFRHKRAGRLSEAVAEQRLIADYYRNLEQQQDRRRRTAEAETDAFLTLAHLIYDANRADYRDAFEAVLAAERYAVLGIMHERRATPQPEFGFVWGVEVPTEFPESLYPLWRFSALLHIVVGADHYLDGRIFSGLPPHKRTPAELDHQLARLAKQAHADLSRLPPSGRPAHFDALEKMSARYERAAAP